jgi:alpha-L-rhamnosidase
MRRREFCKLLTAAATATAAPAIAQAGESIHTNAELAPAATSMTPTIASVRESFIEPPDDARIMMRWWWFGPAVTHHELEREILAMKAGGIGGFEIQPVYPLLCDDASKKIHNLPYLSDEFLEAVRFVSKKAHENGMRIDITLGSGWPYGSAEVPVDEASACLRVVPLDIPSGSNSIAFPALEDGESVIAIFAGDGTAKGYDPVTLQQIELPTIGDRMAIDAKPTPRVVVFYISSHTGQQVKRPAVGAEGFVIDYFNRTAVTHYLQNLGDRLMEAFDDVPPFAVFSDSLEVFGANWTADFLVEFQQRRGYDLIPYLPRLTNGTDETSAELRRDWGLTLTELINERFLTPVNEWAKAHGTRFRCQTYGDPAVSLSSNRLVALPEGEGPQWQSFSYARWATSATHLYGGSVTSAETWTWLHSPAFRATPLDMKAEADRFFLEGITLLVGQGWPYSAPGVAEPGWRFYAAGAFNDHNPWWMVMPDVARYLQRISYLLRQGKPANDVAVLLPNDDAYSEFTLDNVSLSDAMPKYVTQELTQGILNAGYNLDYIDAEAIQRVGIPYPVLVLPHVKRLSPEILRTLIAYVERGGKVIAVGSAPERCPGFAHADAITSQVQRLSQALFAGNDRATVVAHESSLGAALQRIIEPDLKLEGDVGDIGFLHRKLSDSDIYFIANTSNRAVRAKATFRAPRREASWWDPFTGTSRDVNGTPIILELAAYESRVLVFSDTPTSASKAQGDGSVRVIADLTHDWEIRFPPSGNRVPVERRMDQLSSWTSDPQTRFFSGEAVYTKTVTLSETDLRGARAITIDFGTGTPVAADPAIKNGMCALLDAPLREAAIVTVNGEHVGSIWHPPYTLDLTAHLHPGQNRIEVRVANTAINVLAGQAPPDYRLLNLRYGRRFGPQDMENLKPLPSGILGIVQLFATS